MPVLSSGTFRISASHVVTITGAHTIAGGPPFLTTAIEVINQWPAPGATTIAFTVDGLVIVLADSSEIYLDGAGTPIGEEDVPAGFVVDTAQVEASGSAAEYFVRVGATEGADGDFIVEFPPGSSLNDLLATSYGVRVTGPSAFVNAVALTGAYDILAYWWTIPALSACGDRQESHLQLSSADPGAPWARLDPLDPDAAPVPTITHVTPNHGPIAGLNTLVIEGSGFGDGATVDIDGVPATSVAVDSQFQITCVAPAHAAGSVTVVVTNEDGVSS
jgi:hypothetical protein